MNALKKKKQIIFCNGDFFFSFRLNVFRLTLLDLRMIIEIIMRCLEIYKLFKFNSTNTYAFLKAFEPLSGFSKEDVWRLMVFIVM